MKAFSTSNRRTCSYDTHLEYNHMYVRNLSIKHQTVNFMFMQNEESELLLKLQVVADYNHI